ncbi:MAG: hypothetical protein LBB26_03490 [Puniceicoccales bacterium]|jgi:hypothetical protein|nr:hypothetical protein [Puniceicoccales bacterium]
MALMGSQAELLEKYSRAIADAWGPPPISVSTVEHVAQGQLGAIIFYDAGGVPCGPDVKLNGDDFTRSLAEAAQKAVVVSFGTSASGTALLYMVRDVSHVRLAERLARKDIGEHESYFQCLIGPEMRFITYRLPVPPEPWEQRIFTKFADGGFGTAIMAFGGVLTFLITTMVAGTPVDWVGLWISLLLLVLGLAVGCVGQIFHRWKAVGA